MKSDLRHQFYQECQFSHRNWVLSVWKPGSDWLLIKIYKRLGAPHFPTIFTGSTWLSKSLSARAERCRTGNWFTALSAGPISHSHNTHGAASTLREQFIFQLCSNLGRIALVEGKERKRRSALLGARINVARFVEWQWSTLRAEDASPERVYRVLLLTHLSPTHVLEKLALARLSWAASHFWRHVIGFTTLVSLGWFRTPSIRKSDWIGSILFPAPDFLWFPYASSSWLRLFLACGSC